MIIFTKETWVATHENISGPWPWGIIFSSFFNIKTIKIKKKVTLSHLALETLCLKLMHSYEIHYY